MPDLKPETDEAQENEAVSADILTDKDIKNLQKSNLIKALRQTNWRVSGAGGAAELLGVRPTTLADRMRTYKIKRPSS